MGSLLGFLKEGNIKYKGENRNVCKEEWFNNNFYEDIYIYIYSLWRLYFPENFYALRARFYKSVDIMEIGITSNTFSFIFKVKFQ